MADNQVVNLGENSPEHVAYKLFQHVANCENKALIEGRENSADRKYILDTYAECLLAVRSPSSRKEK